MKNRRVIVTGGSGFIGSHLCERLLEHEFKVLNVDRRVLSHPPVGNYSSVYCDITVPGAVLNVAREFDPGVIFHLAALAGVLPGEESPEEYNRVNITGTARVVEAALNCRSKLIFASSSSVYGDGPEELPVHEKSKVNPLSHYARTKFFGESLVTDAGLTDWTVARLFTVYGPRQRQDMFITKAVRTILLNQENVITLRSPTSLRDYTHVSNTVDGLMCCLATCNNVFNIGTGDPVPLFRVLRIIEDALGEKPKKVIIEKMTNVEPQVTCADIGSIAGYGYVPTRKFENGIRNFIEGIKTSWRQ